MSTDRERKALKWMIGIVSFVIWVAVGRGLIFGGDATDASAGQQWAMVLWTAAVIFGAVTIYKKITKE
jgi:hypothetical protein